jgi:hypothetical protein
VVRARGLMGKDEGVKSDPVSICVFFSFWAW